MSETLQSGIPLGAETIHINSIQCRKRSGRKIDNTAQLEYYFTHHTHPPRSRLEVYSRKSIQTKYTKP